MSILDKIKSDLQESRRSGSSSRTDFLRTFLGDVDLEKTRGKTMGDAEVLSMVKKYMNNAQTCVDVGRQHGHDVEDSAVEASYWETYLPKQLPEPDLMALINDLIEKGMSNKGAIMKSLKETHNGQFDGRMASVVIDNQLKGS